MNPFVHQDLIIAIGALGILVVAVLLLCKWLKC